MKIVKYKYKNYFQISMLIQVAAECNVIWTQFMGPQVQIITNKKSSQSSEIENRQMWHKCERIDVRNPDLWDENLWRWFRRCDNVTYFCPGQADHPVNVDSKSYKITEENMGHPDRRDILWWWRLFSGFRWTFDIACAHLYYLMTSDSYSRWPTSHFRFNINSTATEPGLDCWTSYFILPKV